MLTVREIQSLVHKGEPGQWSHTKALYFFIAPSGRPFWAMRYMIKGRRRQMSLTDSIPATARELKQIELLSETEREKIKRGIDPLAEREAVKAAAPEPVRTIATFKSVALDYIAANRDGWKNAKHVQQWENTLKTYAYPVIGHLEPHSITTGDVLKIVKPLWSEKRETGSRVRSRIETVIAAAKAKGMSETPELWASHHNPARWADNLEFWLNGKQARAHFPAMPYVEIPAFFQSISQRDDYSTKALQFLILTGTRTNETLGATWSEIDTEKAVWTIPASRMKAGKEHRVPLSSGALKHLSSLLRMEGNDHLFPGAIRNKSLSNMALLMVMRGLKLGHYVPHGFRSAFRDWAAEETMYPNHIVEMALAHAIKDKVEAAYRRGDLIEKRRQLMEDWSVYLAVRRQQ
ncbi:tyrosine-type recombinase/integrase [Mesorhizobium sp.]|uniref:tyrosine-type recombinase/integrase n=1 Tax=Mesorhizobium sp. TaxID=1871066 RepID=UPI000FE77BA8|nr:MAG: site-specific integrase [Mesorhizobium sp.]